MFSFGSSSATMCQSLPTIVVKPPPPTQRNGALKLKLDVILSQQKKISSQDYTLLAVPGPAPLTPVPSLPATPKKAVLAPQQLSPLNLQRLQFSLRSPSVPSPIPEDPFVGSPEVSPVSIYSSPGELTSDSSGSGTMSYEPSPIVEDECDELMQMTLDIKSSLAGLLNRASVRDNSTLRSLIQCRLMRIEQELEDSRKGSLYDAFGQRRYSVDSTSSADSLLSDDSFYSFVDEDLGCPVV